MSSEILNPAEYAAARAEVVITDAAKAHGVAILENEGFEPGHVVVRPENGSPEAAQLVWKYMTLAASFGVDNVRLTEPTRELAERWQIDPNAKAVLFMVKSHRVGESFSKAA